MASSRVTVTVEVALPSAVTEMGEATTVEVETDTAPVMTVITPESAVKLPLSAWILPVPTRWPVKVGLVPLAVPRSLLATPSVVEPMDQAAETLATKLPEASRLIA